MQNKILVIGSDNYIMGLIFTDNYNIQTIPEMNILNRKNNISLEDVSLIVFTGMNDINPKLYNEERGVFTIVNNQRDVAEINIYNNALKRNIPMLGINRGALLLTVLQKGGRLIQHITNHDNEHTITLDMEAIGSFIDIENLKKNDISNISIHSNHHQLMYPYDIKNHIILGYGNGLSSTYLNGENEEVEMPGDKTSLGITIPREPEIVYYPDTNCLCFQLIENLEEERRIRPRDFVNYMILSSLVNEILMKKKNINLLSFIDQDKFKELKKYKQNITCDISYIDLLIAYFEGNKEVPLYFPNSIAHSLQPKYKSENLTDKILLRSNNRPPKPLTYKSPYTNHHKPKLHSKENQAKLSLFRNIASERGISNTSIDEIISYLTNNSLMDELENIIKSENAMYDLMNDMEHYYSNPEIDQEYIDFKNKYPSVNEKILNDVLDDLEKELKAASVSTRITTTPINYGTIEDADVGTIGKNPVTYIQALDQPTYISMSNSTTKVDGSIPIDKKWTKISPYQQYLEENKRNYTIKKGFTFDKEKPESIF